MKYVLKNWIILTVGFLLTAVSVRAAYDQRGYIAFGGEWFVLPIMLLTKNLVQSIRREVLEWF